MPAEIIAAIGVVIAALITAGPAYLAMRRGVHSEAQRVSDQVTTGFARIHARMDYQDAKLSDMERWQVAHEFEHITATPPRSES